MEKAVKLPTAMKPTNVRFLFFLAILVLAGITAPAQVAPNFTILHSFQKDGPGPWNLHANLIQTSDGIFFWHRQ